MDNSEKLGTIYVEGAGQQIANPISSEDGVDLKQIYTTVPEDKGRILDVGNAQELAKTENTLGQSARVAQEKSMEFVANEGMTEIQKRNSELMDGIEQKYPDAFFKTIDEKGRKVLVANGKESGANERWCGQSMVFTRDGVMLVHNESINGSKQFIEKTDWTKFGDMVENSQKGETKGWFENSDRRRETSVYFDNVAHEGNKTQRSISMMEYSLEKPNDLESIKSMLQTSETLGEERKRRENVAPPMKAADLLASL